MPADHFQILVVDDEVAIREVLSEFLETENYKVFLADDGDGALEILEDENIDILLTDIEMPRMNGMELLRRARDLRHAPLPVVMTGYATVENAIETLRLGAHDYILKPFKIDDVMHTVRKAVEKLKLERENIQLKQAVSLYYVSEAMSLSLPVDTILDVITDTVLQEIGLDLMVVYVENRDGVWERRKRKSKVPHVTGRIIDALRPEELRERFAADDSVLLNGEEARLLFTHAPDVEGVVAVPLRARNRVLGAMVGISTTPGEVFHEGERRLFSILGGRMAAAIDNSELYRNLQQNFAETIEGLVGALEARDEYTAGHSQRVARWAEIIAKLAGLSTQEVGRVRRAAILHDIGKIGVDPDSLTKPGKLTPEEYEAFKDHASISKRILEPLQFLGPVIHYVYSHHERYDGAGYPEGLAGEDIPLGARIVCLADSFEVMSTDRVYRKRLPRDVAIAELRRCAGTHFDPKLTELFVAYLEKFPDFRSAMENEEFGKADQGIVSALV